MVTRHSLTYIFLFLLLMCVSAMKSSFVYVIRHRNDLKLQSGFFYSSPTRPSSRQILPSFLIKVLSVSSRCHARLELPCTLVLVINLAISLNLGCNTSLVILSL
ncbi:hypothetical protein F4809DRAFT_114954 [Biscogniauxia mediterranea]|nr:hypothetical protein F4809DRAFT_114954 [Biscogniauxia mediterranea]